MSRTIPSIREIGTNIANNNIFLLLVHDVQTCFKLNIELPFYNGNAHVLYAANFILNELLINEINKDIC